MRLASLGSVALAGGMGLRPLSAADQTPAPGARKLGVALLGLGRYSAGQLGPALRETRLCRLAGVITGNPGKADQWARDFGLPKDCLYNYENMDRIADNRAIDIVYVVTPPGIHRDFAVRAARAGKHVISEKPMATTVADCDAMIAACAEAKVKLSIGYRLHFDPYHRELMRLARDRDFGEFRKMTGDRGFVMKARSWRIDKALAGGGPMMDLGIYVIHGACMAADGATPVTVSAREEPKIDPALFNEVEETMRWRMEFANGAACDAVSSYSHNADWFRAEGDRGWFDLREHAFTYRGIGCVTSRGALHYDPPINQQAAQMDDFADCILTGRATPVPGELGRRDIRILAAIYEAARTGGAVRV